MRRANADRYDRLFGEAALSTSTGGPITLPARAPGREHIFNQYVVRVAGPRPRQGARCRRAGIGTEIYYPVPFHLQECFASLGYGRGDFPEAERAAAETLALPIYGELTEAQQREVVGAIAESLG